MRPGTGLEMEDFRVKSEEELDDKNGEAAGKVKKSGCLKQIRQLCRITETEGSATKLRQFS